MIAKRTIPLIIAAVVGFILIATYFIPLTEQWGANAMEMFIILAAAAMVLGAGNLVMMNLTKISRRSAGWGYAAITLIAFAVVLIIGLFKMGAHGTAVAPDNAWASNPIQEGAPFWWIYQYCLVPLTATMFAMLAFYIASAAFRAFRAKNLEATLLLGTAFIVLLGQVYAGYWLTDWLPDAESMAEAGTSNSPWYQFLSGLRMENLTKLILDVPQTAGNRAIMIGIALGIVSTSLKVLLGVDKSYLGSED
ncbi:MAG: hypothetical protein MK074_01005 [Phycisphaerales bacterium]|nr:hypothetical protein [Phycisphaerales bacterium]